MPKAVIIGVVVLAVLIIGFAMWPDDDPAPGPEPVEAPPAPEPGPPEPEQPEPQPAPPPEPQPEPEPPLPPLTESDEFVRERLEPMDLPENWVEQGDYVRRLAVLAENASRGTYPRRQLGFLTPEQAFKVVERGDEAYIDPASYERYDPYVEELTSVDPQQLAGLLETVNPLVETALEELGVEAPPGEVFEAAMREVLEVPVLEGDVELVQPNVMYQYADPDLESLSPLKKQVLRMGPENVQRLQDYVRRLAEEMDLEA